MDETVSAADLRLTRYRTEGIISVHTIMIYKPLNLMNLLPDSRQMSY